MKKAFSFSIILLLYFSFSINSFAFNLPYVYNGHTYTNVLDYHGYWGGYNWHQTIYYNIPTNNAWGTFSSRYQGDNSGQVYNVAMEAVLWIQQAPEYNGGNPIINEYWFNDGYGHVGAGIGCGSWCGTIYTENLYSSQDILELTGSTVWFEANVFTFTTHVNPNNAGTVSLSPSGGGYEADTEVETTANPNSGYEFAYWEWNNGASSSTNNPETFTMDEDLEVTAVFFKTFRDVVGDGFYEEYDPQDPEVYGDGECVTYVKYETGITDISGNASTWYSGAISAGYYTTEGPTIPTGMDMSSAIIVFGRISDESFPYGHVGIIINKIDSTNLNIRDANWHLDGKLYEHSIDVTSEDYNILGYIYHTPPTN
jgi:surface antigen